MSKTPPTTNTPQIKKEVVDVELDKKELLDKLKESRTTNSTLSSRILTLEGELKAAKESRDDYRGKNEHLIEERGAHKLTVNKLEVELKALQDKYNKLVEDYKTTATEKPSVSSSEIEEEEETGSETALYSEKRDTHAKPVPSNEFISIVDLFLSEGADVALERVNWLFSVYNVYETRSRIHYLITNVFNRPNETRDSLLKVANALSDCLSSNEKVDWKRITEIVKNCDNSSKRKAEAWDAFVKTRTIGVNLDGTNLEAYLLKWNKAQTYWSTALTTNERFSNLLGGLHETVMLEVLKLKEALSDDQFMNSKQDQWFTWIRKSVQTICNAREIKQIRESTKKSNFSPHTNTNTNTTNTVNTTKTSTPSQTQSKPQFNNNQRQHTKSNACFACGQAPELLAIRIKIADKWCTAIFDTGCTHSIIHPKLVKDNMKKTNCYVKIITPILSEPYAAKSQVNVKFNLECDVKAEVQFKMYVASIPYHAILGMDFINGVDMSNTTEGQWLSKYFKNSNDLVRTTIPLYKYPINKNTTLRQIKTQVGTNTDFKLTNIQKLNLLALDYDKPPLNPPSPKSIPKQNQHPSSPSNQPITTQNTEVENQRMKNEAHKILNKFKDIFVEQIPKFEPPSRQGFDMEVKVAEGSLPIKRSYNKMSEEESNKIEAEIKRLFEIGVIEESISSYSAPVFIATSKGKERVVFDYRGVNKQTEEFAFPMPNGEEILKATKDCKYFSVVDAKAGFHLLQVKKEHRSYTAFSFKGKLYQFRRAPFGMKNSPAYFNKWIQSIIEEFKEFARAYVDDIIIFSKTLEDHITHVNKVLEKLRREKVYLAANKAELFKDSVKFFGHVVSREGFKPVLDKVEAINNLSEPTTVTELRSFLGSCNYLRRFIPNYSELTARLAALTGSKTTRVTITDEMRDDIKRLKQAITSAPVLAKPDFSKSFDVYIDASDIGTGCVIMQDDGSGNIRPILYDSCRFSKYQRNYTTTDREFLALINVLDRHGYMLKDKRFRLFTDHLNLTYYEELKEPTKRIIRYLDKASEYKFDVIHVRGEDNNIADMLSRDGTFDSTWEPEFIEKIKKEYVEFEAKESEWFDTFKSRQDVVDVDGLWYLIDANTGSKRLLLVDKETINLVLEEAHSTIYSGHSSTNKMVNKLKTHYYFPKFINVITRFTESCQECQKNRIDRAKSGLLKPLPIPSRPWNDISMDFLNLPKSNAGKDSVMVVVCRLSKMCKIIPCTKELKADEAAKLFWDNIVCNFGLPATIVSDRDKLFTSDLWNNLMEIAGVKLKMTAPSRPQADGQTERMNRNIVNLLSKMTSNRLNWDIEIKSIEFAINNTVNSSTGQTPFSVLLGFHPRTPLNINSEYNLPYLEAAEYYRQAARDNMVDAQITMALQYNKDRDDFKFEVGDLVLVKREKVNIAMINDKDQSKVLPNYCGPFKIVSKKSELNYSIRIQNHKGGHRIVHVSDMKPFIEDDNRIFKRSDSNYKPLEEEIDKIVDKRNRMIGRGSRIEYRVRFTGKTEDHDMWLPLFALEKCGKFIKVYEDLIKSPLPSISQN
ncbi:hypothetical protein ACTFIZ_011547 [Dictyostelium cf. discoideum]